MRTGAQFHRGVALDAQGEYKSLVGREGVFSSYLQGMEAGKRQMVVVGSGGRVGSGSGQRFLSLRFDS